MSKNVITIDDLSNDEIKRLFDLADDYVKELGEDPSSHRLKGHLDIGGDFIAATLFFEPSTRTKFSFEAAMFRLGGNILQAVDPKNTSSAKGESLADTVRVVQSYADILVLRHPLEGAARAAAQKVAIPVINAGDGSHEHPTQTLCDLYTLRRERGSLDDLNVLICGDLKNGRTVHSLVYALARFGATILTNPAPGLELPPHVHDRLESEYQYIARTKEHHPELPDYVGTVFVPLSKLRGHRRYEKVTDEERLEIGEPTAVYVTPEEPHSLALIPSGKLVAEAIAQLDVFYMTRLQTERVAKKRKRRPYPVIDKSFLDDRGYSNTKVLHPLPRVGELGSDLDEDPRGAYFRQTAYGVPIRMALMAALLGIAPVLDSAGSDSHYFRTHTANTGFKCTNPRCIANADNEGITQTFWIVNPAQQSLLEERPLTLRCVFCEYDYQPAVVGKASSKEYFTDTHVWDRIEAEDLIVFDKPTTAENKGFRHAPVNAIASAELV